MPKIKEMLLLLALHVNPVSAAAMESSEGFTVEPPTVELKVGEQQQITVILKKTFPYTPVFGWDNSAIGTLTAQGLFTAQFPGRGLITISAGHQRQQIYVKVVE